MSRQILTSEEAYEVLMASNDESLIEESVEGSSAGRLWDFPENLEQLPVIHDTRRDKIKKNTKSRVEEEQEMDDANFIEEEPAPIFTEIARVSNLGEYEVASNIEFEIIDQIQNYNITPKKAIKWKYAQFETSAVDFEPYSEAIHEIYESDSPGEYFSKYFTDDLFQTMAKFTNMYALQNNQSSFKLTNAGELRKLIGLHIFFGSTGFPQLKMYWDSLIGIQLVREVMSKKRFHSLRSNLHFVDNLAATDTDKNDKFYKLRPLLNTVRSRLLQLQPEKNLSVDEQMIPFKGHLCIKQYIKGKPCPWGLKVYVICGNSGQPYDFLMYQGANTEISAHLKQQFGLGAAIVLHLCQQLEKKGHNLFCDNFFTTYALLEVLKQKGINAAGTVRLNRFSNPPFTSDHLFKKKIRGEVEEIVSQDEKIVVIKWLDSRTVHLASNFVGKGLMGTVQRYDPKSNKINKYITISQPEIIKLFNDSMGGVDLLDQFISYYRIFIKSTKWTLRVIMHFLDFAICSSWIEYRRDMLLKKKGGKKY